LRNSNSYQETVALFLALDQKENLKL